MPLEPLEDDALEIRLNEPPQPVLTLMPEPETEEPDLHSVREVSPPIVRPVTAQDTDLDASAITGTYDCWLGKVEAVFYAGADGQLGYVQTVHVSRSAPAWGTNNEPSFNEIAPVASQPQRGWELALPFPPRHDQQLYHVAVGDPVTVFTGRDGRCYFISDELPFVAVIIKPSGTAATERYAGGANYYRGGGGADQYEWRLRVRRYLVTGTTGTEGASLLSPVLNAAGANVEYDGVVVLGGGTQQHGYRVGDRILVHRRGSFLYAMPCRESFLAYIVNAGPESEAEFTTNHYWGREVSNNATAPPTLGDNAWEPETGGVGVGGLTPAEITQTDPTGSGGRYGRWIDAMNTAEPPGSHRIKAVAPADPTVATATFVLVHAYDMLVSGRGSTSVPFYVFEHRTKNHGVAKIVSNDGGGTYTITEQEWNSVGATWQDVTAPYGHIGATAHEIQLRTGGLANQYVLFWEETGTDGSTRLVMDKGPAVGSMMAVKCWQDGGSTDGDGTTKCNRLYTVRTIDATAIDTGGVVLGTGMSPERTRGAWQANSMGTYICPPATGGGVIGMGYFNAVTFVLWDAGEVIYTDNCPP